MAMFRCGTPHARCRLMRPALFLAAAFVVAAPPVNARAQTRQERDPHDAQRMEPSRGALELSGGAGLVQGVGVISRDQPSSDQLGGWGYGAFASAAYRATDAMSFGVGFAYEGLGAMRDDAARSYGARLEATRHFDPSGRADPWMKLGAGYRFVQIASSTSTPSLFAHGFEILSLRFGADFRRTTSFAFGPVGGLDLTLFTWQRWGDGPMAASAHPAVTALLTMGLQARFDIGGAR